MLIALTRPVSATINRCELTHLGRTAIDLPKAISQHADYERRLAALGCHLERLPALPECPDAVFVEDTCVVFNEVAIMTRPGAASRRPEIASVAEVVKRHRPLHWIKAPGMLDGGDVLHLGQQVFVGRSTRTDSNGIEQLRDFLTPHGYEVKAIDIAGGLHLKSAVTAIAEHAILVNPSWVDPRDLGAERIIDVDQSEPAAANALRIGTAVVYPTVFPKTQKRLEDRGIELLTVDLSELAKAEGAVTCCSLLFDSPLAK